MSASHPVARRAPLAELHASTFSAHRQACGSPLRGAVPEVDAPTAKEAERAEKTSAREAESRRLKEAGLALSQLTSAATSAAHKEDMRAARKAEKKALKHRPALGAGTPAAGVKQHDDVDEAAASGAAEPCVATPPAADPPLGSAATPPTPTPPPVDAAALPAAVPPAAAPPEAATGDPASPQPLGRLVLRDSTPPLDGLADLLTHLLAEHHGIRAAVPGDIKGGLAFRPALELADFEPLHDGQAGFTCLARKGAASQAVVLATSAGVSLDSVLAAQERALRGEIGGRGRPAGGGGGGGGGGGSGGGGGGRGWGCGNPNREGNGAAEAANKVRLKAKHMEMEAAAKSAALDKHAHALEARLRATGATREQKFDIAASARKWAQEQRGEIEQGTRFRKR